MHITVIKCKATVTFEIKIKEEQLQNLWVMHGLILFNYQFKKGHLDRSVDIRNSIVAIEMSLLIVKLKLGLPYRNI